MRPPHGALTWDLSSWSWAEASLAAATSRPVTASSICCLVIERRSDGVWALSYCACGGRGERQGSGGRVFSRRGLGRPARGPPGATAGQSRESKDDQQVDRLL